MEVSRTARYSIERKVELASRLQKLVDDVTAVLDQYPYIDSLIEKRILRSEKFVDKVTLDGYVVNIKQRHGDPTVLMLEIARSTEIPVSIFESEAVYLVSDSDVRLPCGVVKIGNGVYGFPPKSTGETLFFALNPHLLTILSERLQPVVRDLANLTLEIVKASSIKQNFEVLAEKAVEVVAESSIFDGFGTFHLKVHGKVLVGVGSEIADEPPDYISLIPFSYVDVKLGGHVTRIITTMNTSKLFAKLIPTEDLELAVSELERLLEAVKKAKVATVVLMGTLFSGIFD